MKQTNIAVSKLRPFENNPYQVRDDEEMNTLIESIQTQGILSPLIVRPIENTEERQQPRPGLQGRCRAAVLCE